MIRKIPDDSDKNYDIVHMIKKIAIGLESKNVDDLRAIAHELEACVPHGNCGKLDVKTKVFVEHILVGLARIQLGLKVLDKGADELSYIRQKMEKDDIHYVMDESEYDELEKEMNELAQETTRDNIDEFCKRNLDSVDRRQKFTCEKCGQEKRTSAPGASNYKEVDGHGICGRCYRAFRNWFEKTDEKLDDSWVENDKLSRDERQKKINDIYKKVSWMKENFGYRDKKGIDWDRYHKKRRGRFKKDEFSDEEKDGLK